MMKQPRGVYCNIKIQYVNIVRLRHDETTSRSLLQYQNTVCKHCEIKAGQRCNRHMDKKN